MGITTQGVGWKVGWKGNVEFSQLYSKINVNVEALGLAPDTFPGSMCHAGTGSSINPVPIIISDPAEWGY